MSTEKGTIITETDWYHRTRYFSDNSGNTVDKLKTKKDKTPTVKCNITKFIYVIGLTSEQGFFILNGEKSEIQTGKSVGVEPGDEYSFLGSMELLVFNVTQAKKEMNTY